MCLVAIALHAHPRYRLIVAANRDEFHARPSLPAHAWEPLSGVFGGRDLEGGGSWFAVDATGRFALVTNIRRFPMREGRSRGELIAQFLSSAEDAETQAKAIADQTTQFRPFNLVLGSADQVWFVNSDRGEAQGPEPGAHGLSNADLDTHSTAATPASARSGSGSASIPKTHCSLRADTRTPPGCSAPSPSAACGNAPPSPTSANWRHGSSAPFARSWAGAGAR